MCELIIVILNNAVEMMIVRYFVFIDWIEPHQNESLEDYSGRLCSVIVPPLKQSDLIKIEQVDIDGVSYLDTFTKDTSKRLASDGDGFVDSESKVIKLKPTTRSFQVLEVIQERVFINFGSEKGVVYGIETGLINGEKSSASIVKKGQFYFIPALEKTCLIKGEIRNRYDIKFKGSWEYDSGFLDFNVNEQSFMSPVKKDIDEFISVEDLRMNEDNVCNFSRKNSNP
jgi:hypothetical protein